jgi:hypothetical protein
MDPNFDPRDESESRPQVTFVIRADVVDRRGLFDVLSKQQAELALPCHDMMIFDQNPTGTPGVIRFQWDTPRSTVDRAAAWLLAVSGLEKVTPFYGDAADAV